MKVLKRKPFCSFKKAVTQICKETKKEQHILNEWWPLHSSVFPVIYSAGSFMLIPQHTGACACISFTLTPKWGTQCSMGNQNTDTAEHCATCNVSYPNRWGTYNAESAGSVTFGWTPTERVAACRAASVIAVIVCMEVSLLSFTRNRSPWLLWDADNSSNQVKKNNNNQFCCFKPTITVFRSLWGSRQHLTSYRTPLAYVWSVWVQHWLSFSSVFGFYQSENVSGCVASSMLHYVN